MASHISAPKPLSPHAARPSCPVAAAAPSLTAAHPRGPAAKRGHSRRPPTLFSKCSQGCSRGESRGEGRAKGQPAPAARKEPPTPERRSAPRGDVPAPLPPPPTPTHRIPHPASRPALQRGAGKPPPRLAPAPDARRSPPGPAWATPAPPAPLTPRCGGPATGGGVRAGGRAAPPGWASWSALRRGGEGWLRDSLSAPPASSAASSSLPPFPPRFPLALPAGEAAAAPSPPPASPPLLPRAPDPAPAPSRRRGGGRGQGPAGRGGRNAGEGGAGPSEPPRFPALGPFLPGCSLLGGWSRVPSLRAGAESAAWGHRYLQSAVPGGGWRVSRLLQRRSHRGHHAAPATSPCGITAGGTPPPEKGGSRKSTKEQKDGVWVTRSGVDASKPWGCAELEGLSMAAGWDVDPGPDLGNAGMPPSRGTRQDC
ncbi:uncharacterized protein LOC135407806 [Pseudopipra pipra]|uniref:uncharacterized protein LOC135407806 n=1 Tax=Pseudopipra pipra TaxID=415032 RepID=UPI00313A0A50